MKELRDFVKLPLRLFWEVTSECNFRCKHCYADAGKRRADELNHQEALELLDEFKRIGIFDLFIAGGEPLMRKDIFDILERLSDNTISVTMSTNGSFIDEDIAERLRRCNLGLVTVSLDGSTPRTHEQFRRAEGSFEKAVQALGLLHEHHVTTSVGYVLHRENYLEVPGVIALCIEHGVRLINIMRIAPVGRAAGADGLSLTCSMYQEFLQGFEQIYEEAKNAITILSDNPVVSTWLAIKKEREGEEVKSHYCDAGGFTGYMQANGNVLPCGYFPVVLGNVRHSSLKAIWASTAAQRVRDLACQLPSECTECEYLSYCRGGCRGVCFSLYERTDARDPICFKEFKERVGFEV
ncbi:MAG: radical SAM protein [Theionarchaea archaeon]|nr:radical SAM protein [Theionarchaea archaeon]MBU7038816.1 radical SAM protein [Theionarchaea archaeon]